MCDDDVEIKFPFFFLVSRSNFGSKNDLIRDEFEFFNEGEIEIFCAFFFRFLTSKKILTCILQLKKNERPRERTTTSTTANEDDNHDGTSRDRKTNDGGKDPVGRGRFGTTGDE